VKRQRICSGWEQTCRQEQRILAREKFNLLSITSYVYCRVKAHDYGSVDTEVVGMIRRIRLVVYSRA
jgi:hypothetical protein